MSMLNLYPRHQLQASSVDDDADGNNGVVDRHGGASFGYSIAVVCVTVFVFCVLVSSISVGKACASASLAALLLIVAGCFAKKMWFHPRSSRPGASAELVVTVTAGAARPGFPSSQPQVYVLPAFAFECPPLEAGGGVDPAPPPAASCVVCSVCLEDMRGGEMVRQLPACMHIFHAGCIDMWLHSHRTCPMCRCVISHGAAVTSKADAAEEAPESSDDDHDLPPV